ncbi:hypothetical protein GQ42DRAFT_171904 [Ramicandelaber brevisporus]|nr:hypothetical protein GQ42DRAFT_171904 [Ramicandelaber brevisporus]
MGITPKNKSEAAGSKAVATSTPSSRATHSQTRAIERAESNYPASGNSVGSTAITSAHRKGYMDVAMQLFVAGLLDDESDAGDSEFDDSDSDVPIEESKKHQHAAAGEKKKKKKKYGCDYDGCTESFGSTKELKYHKPDHETIATVLIRRRKYKLFRETTEDDWPCAFPECGKPNLRTFKMAMNHIDKCHPGQIQGKRYTTTIWGKGQPIYDIHYSGDFRFFYIAGVECGFHPPTKMYVCYKCRCAPAELLVHLKEFHGVTFETIEPILVPPSALKALDPNDNQHEKNPILAAALNGEELDEVGKQYIVNAQCCDIDKCMFTDKDDGNAWSDHYQQAHDDKSKPRRNALAIRVVYGEDTVIHFLVKMIDEA